MRCRMLYTTAGRRVVVKIILATIATCFLTGSFGMPFKMRVIHAAASYPVPEAGQVSGGAYQNEYFGFRYPLPAGWEEDVQGPPPSATAYYSLLALKPRDSLSATLLIAAQDEFFAQEQSKDAMDFLAQMKEHLDPSLESGQTIPLDIAGQSFAKLDYLGAGLRHAVFATEVRCHILIFSVTSSHPEQIETVAASLNRMTFAKGQSSRWPICVPAYATPDHLVHRVEPAPAGPRFSGVPTRIVIGSDGKVEQVHPIGGLAEQDTNIREALTQWKFKPYELNGKRVAVETGLVVRFAGTQ